MNMYKMIIMKIIFNFFKYFYFLKSTLKFDKIIIILMKIIIILKFLAINNKLVL